MTESNASRRGRESGQGKREAASWADPLSRAERRELATRLAHAARRYGFKDWNTGLYSPARAAAAAECSDLHLDVTERAEVPSS